MTKREKIPYMTSEQAADELTLKAFESLVKKARKRYGDADAAHDAVFQALDDMCIDGDTPFAPHGEVKNIGVNNDITEAINLYILHNEGSLADIMRAVRRAYTEREE